MTRANQYNARPMHPRRRLAPLAPALLLVLCLATTTFSAPVADPSPLLKQGKAALEDELYGLAERRLASYLEAAAFSLPPEQIEEALALFLEALHGQDRHADMLKAFETHETWIRRIGNSTELTYWKALAEFELQRYEKALALLATETKDKPPDILLARIQHLSAWCLLEAGQQREAIKAFSLYAKRHSGLADLPGQLLAWAHAILPTHRSDAIATLQSLAAMSAIHPAVQQGQFELGELLAEDNQLDLARNHFSAVSTNSAAHANLRARAYFSRAGIEEAVTNYVQAIRMVTNGLHIAKDPDLNQKGSYDHGRLLLKTGDLERGIPLLKSFVSSAPGDPLAEQTQLHVAEALLDRERYDAAISEFQIYLESFTNQTGRARAHRGKGWGLFNVKRFAEAATEFTKGFERYTLSDGREECLFKAGDAYFANQQYQLAATTYDTFLETFPSSSRLPSAHFQLAESLLRGKEPVKAQIMFRGLVEKFPAHPAAAEALLRIADIKLLAAEDLNREGRWSDASTSLAAAIETFSQVINVYSNSPFTPDAYHGRGRAHYYRYEFSPAARDFNHVVTSFPDSSVCDHASYMLGRCYYSMAQDKLALATWQSFVETRTNSVWTPRIQFELAKYRYSAEEHAEAEREFLDFVKRFPKDPEADHALLRAGKAAFKQKEYRRVVEILGRMAREYPDSPRLAEARFQQAEALYQLAEYAAVILICDEITNKSKDNELVNLAQLRKGDCQFWLGAEDKKRYTEAIESYRAVANNSDAPMHLAYEALYKTGRCFEKLDRQEEALKQYHSQLMVRFLEEREKEIQHDEETKSWFWRASKAAADIMEAREEWRKVIKILERAVDADVPAANEARERIKRIRAERWWLFF